MKLVSRFVLGALCLVSAAAAAQGFPAKPLRLIVPYSVGTPPDIVVKLHDTVTKILATPEMQERLTNNGAETRPGSAGDFGAGSGRCRLAIYEASAHLGEQKCSVTAPDRDSVGLNGFPSHKQLRLAARSMRGKSSA